MVSKSYFIRHYTIVFCLGNAHGRFDGLTHSINPARDFKPDKNFCPNFMCLCCDFQSENEKDFLEHIKIHLNNNIKQLELLKNQFKKPLLNDNGIN